VRVVIAAVGVPRREPLGVAIRDYESRAARYWPLEIREVREESARATSPDLVRAREAERLLARAGDRGRLVACDERGILMQTREFADWMRKQRELASRDVVFVLGGAYGLGDAVLRQADMQLALARWTLPHDLARLVLTEQLYRAGTLLRGEPYHK
jgi:23S rRNA (pseudouridine1915-N3)-methyltransferase